LVIDADPPQIHVTVVVCTLIIVIAIYWRIIANTIGFVAEIPGTGVIVVAVLRSVNAIPGQRIAHVVSAILAITTLHWNINTSSKLITVINGTEVSVVAGLLFELTVPRRWIAEIIGTGIGVVTFFHPIEATTHLNPILYPDLATIDGTLVVVVAVHRRERTEAGGQVTLVHGAGILVHAHLGLVHAPSGAGFAEILGAQVAVAAVLRHVPRSGPGIAEIHRAGVAVVDLDGGEHAAHHFVAGVHRTNVVVPALDGCVLAVSREYFTGVCGAGIVVVAALRGKHAGPGEGVAGVDGAGVRIVALDDLLEALRLLAH
jgi:hypothetical protein